MLELASVDLRRSDPVASGDELKTVSKFDAFIDRQNIENLISGAIGSQFGCLGAWMLAIYLRVRDLEREVAGSGAAWKDVPSLRAEKSNLRSEKS